MKFQFSNEQLLLLFFCSIFFSAFFSATEASFLAWNRVRLNRLLQSNFILSRLCVFLHNRFNKLIVVILSCNMLANFLATFSASNLFHRYLSSIEKHDLFFLKNPFIDVVFVVFFTLFILLFVEFTPKQIAIYFSHFVSHLVSPVILIFYLFFLPLFFVWEEIFVRFFMIFSHFHKKEGNLKLSRHSNYSFNYDELRGYILLGAETGALKKLEGDLLDRAVHYMDVPATSFLVPRDKILGINVEQGDQKNILRKLKKFPHQQIPLYENQKDNIVGVVSKKHLACLDDHEIDSIEKLKKHGLKPVVIPESKNVLDVLSDIYESKCDVAIVTDEYGGIEGLVFYADIVSRLFGSENNLKQHHKQIGAFSKKAAIVDGHLSISEINRYFSTEISCSEAETLAGYLLEKFRRIPQKNETFSDDFFHYEIKQSSSRKINTVLLRKK